MSVQAVVFDYGMVLSGPQEPAAFAKLKSITGLSDEDFDKAYWADRHAYDRGELTGEQFWQKLSHDCRLGLDAAALADLNHWDVRMWSSVNEGTLAWQRKLKALGIKTGILSNMGDSVLLHLQREHAWIEDFDVLIWSYQHLLAKPEPEIYQLLLERLGTPAEETLFLDDKIENIEAARKLGIIGLQFTTVEQLRQDLISSGLDQYLPLP